MITAEDRKEAFRYINAQLEYGYLDLGAHDEDEGNSHGRTSVKQRRLKRWRSDKN